MNQKEEEMKYFSCYDTLPCAEDTWQFFSTPRDAIAAYLSEETVTTDNVTVYQFAEKEFPSGAIRFQLEDAIHDIPSYCEGIFDEENCGCDITPQMNKLIKDIIDEIKAHWQRYFEIVAQKTYSIGANDEITID